MSLPGQSARDRSLAARARGPDRLLGALMLLAAGLLVLGWVLPIMTVERLFFLAERVSILEAAARLWTGDHGLLALVVVLFSMVFPAVKLGLALYLWHGADLGDPRLRRLLRWIEAVGRWSMLDVFVVALTVVAIEVSLISDVEAHAGLYVFTAGVVLSIATVQRVAHLARAAAG